MHYHNFNCTAACSNRDAVPKSNTFASHGRVSDFSGFLDGSIWGTTDVQGAGHRSRWATTAEMSMPVFSMLTVDVSGRYDDYSVLNQHVKHGTYNIGLEFRPWEMLQIGRAHV